MNDDSDRFVMSRYLNRNDLIDDLLSAYREKLGSIECLTKQNEILLEALKSYASEWNQINPKRARQALKETGEIQ